MNKKITGIILGGVFLIGSTISAWAVQNTTTSDSLGSKLKAKSASLSGKGSFGSLITTDSIIGNNGNYSQETVQKVKAMVDNYNKTTIKNYSTYLSSNKEGLSLKNKLNNAILEAQKLADSMKEEDPVVTPEEKEQEKGEVEVPEKGEVEVPEKGEVEVPEKGEVEEKEPEATVETHWEYDPDEERWKEYNYEGDFTGRYKLTEDGEIINGSSSGEEEVEGGGNQEGATDVNKYTFTYNGYECTVYYDDEGNPVSIKAIKNGKTTTKDWEDVSSKNQKIILAQLNNYLHPAEGGETSEGSAEVPADTTRWEYDSDTERWLEINSEGNWTGNYKWTEDGEIHSSGSSSEGEEGEDEGNQEYIPDDGPEYHWELNEDGVWMEFDDNGDWTGKTSETDPTVKQEEQKKEDSESTASGDYSTNVTVNGVEYTIYFDQNASIKTIERTSSGYEYNLDELDTDIIDTLNDAAKEYIDGITSAPGDTTGEDEAPKKEKVPKDEMPTAYSYDLNSFEVIGYDENGNELVRNPMQSVEKELGGRTCTVYLDMDGNPMVVYEHQEGMVVEWDNLSDTLKNEYYTGSQTTEKEDASAPAESEPMTEKVIIDVREQQEFIDYYLTDIANKENELERYKSFLEDTQKSFEMNKDSDDTEYVQMLQDEIESLQRSIAQTEKDISYYEQEIDQLKTAIADELARGAQFESQGYEVEYLTLDLSIKEEDSGAGNTGNELLDIDDLPSDDLAEEYGNEAELK